LARMGAPDTLDENEDHRGDAAGPVVPHSEGHRTGLRHLKFMPPSRRRLPFPPSAGLTVGLALALGVTAPATSAAAPELLNDRARLQSVTSRNLEDISPDAPLQRPRSAAARSYPAPKLERVALSLHGNSVRMNQLPEFTSTFAGKVAGITPRDEYVFYSLDPELQQFVQNLLRQVRAPHAAIVAMEPDTGKILAIADKSNSGRDLSLHTGFPAASIFKIVTTAAALERQAVVPESLIRFRGGTYTLNKWNYAPNSKTDRRVMAVQEALAKSCNPVFARIALKHLNPGLLKHYARLFGFNTPLHFDSALPMSAAHIPSTDFELSRTAAGFGQVTLSPVHAAAMMAGLAHDGNLPRPSLVERVISRHGDVLYQSRPAVLHRLVQPRTARTLMTMMEYTTTIGTSRREFMRKNRPVLPGIRVAAKTGTLSGTNPKGVNNWFVAAAPIDNPRIALSVIVVNPSSIDTKSSHLGRLVIQRYLSGS